ncbi:hypothetical protein [Pseudolysinimonas sp.]
MSRDAAPTVRIDRDGSRVRITGVAYALSFDEQALRTRAPLARLEDADGATWSELSLLASAHTRTGADETLRVVAVEVAAAADVVEVRVAARSSTWARRETVLRCSADRVELRVELDGTGDLTDVELLGGRAALPTTASGEFRSRIGFAGVLVPAATEPVQLVRPAAVPGVLGVIGDADAGRLNAVFSPPPLAFGLSREAPHGATDVPGGDWLGMWLRAPVDELAMTAVRYVPLDGGFLLRLDYEGHTPVDGSWTSPTVVLRPAASGWGVLDDYRADLAAAGLAPGRTHSAGWWSEPLFCGWGAQCARAARDARGIPMPAAGTPPEEVALAGAARPAPWYARQHVYDEFLARLDAHDLDPGTIVVDDRWQASYGLGTVDEEAWPDLKGWIAARHAEGRRVLLWWKAWDAEGVPAEECVRTADGEPFTVDAGNPAYRARLAGIVRHLLSADGLDADGFKLDFTQRGPSGQSLVGTPGVWGMAALHLLLRTMADAAREVKPDALLIAHSMHPSFGDVFDMARLNDVTERDVHGRRIPVTAQLELRAGITARVLPEHLVDTDQWPMPDRAQWRSYVEAQPRFGVPALYYLEAIDNSGEELGDDDLALVRDSWAAYRSGGA